MFVYWESTLIVILLWWKLRLFVYCPLRHARLSMFVCLSIETEKLLLLLYPLIELGGFRLMADHNETCELDFWFSPRIHKIRAMERSLELGGTKVSPVQLNYDTPARVKDWQ